MSHPLDRCVWRALSGRQAGLSEVGDGARRYRREFAPFAAAPDDSPASLRALRAILPAGGGGGVVFTPNPLDLSGELVALRRATVVQMALERDNLARSRAALPATARALEAADIPAMRALAALTKPGPFAERTAEMGHFLGVFNGGDLVAMSGERMLLDGFVEISAVCTHPDHRGRGFAAALIVALAEAAFARGETPFLHAFADNAAALSVYRNLGFSHRADMHMAVVESA